MNQRQRGSWIQAGMTASALLLSAPHALADEAKPSEAQSGSAQAAAPSAVLAPEHGPSSTAFPSHHFQLAPHSPERAQLGVNFGLLQLALHGVNVAAELRYKRLWLEYSHGQSLTLNHRRSALSSEERAQGLHVYVPYTTGFGVGATVLDELWVGVEFKLHRFEVSNEAGFESRYSTVSIGPVVGYKLFVWRGLYADLYARYWPNVATTLRDGSISYPSGEGTSTHHAHEFGFFGNVSLGWAFDL